MTDFEFLKAFEKIAIRLAASEIDQEEAEAQREELRELKLKSAGSARKR